MILYWIICAIFAYLAIKDWQKTTLLWFPIQLLFNDAVCIKYTSPAISQVLAVDIFIISIAFFHKAFKKNEKFIFGSILISYIISFILSDINSNLFFTNLLNNIKYYIVNFIFIFLLQKAIQTNDDIILFIKALIFTVVCIISLAISEVILKDNIVLDYVWNNAPQELIEGKMFYSPPHTHYGGELGIRYGGIRAYSFFHIHIFFGSTCVILSFLFFYLSTHLNDKLKKFEKYFVYLGMSCILGVFLSNSKSPLIGLGIMILAFLSYRKFLNLKTILFAIILIIIIGIYFPSYITNIYAIFDDNLAQEAGGSSKLMRIIQFKTAFELFLQKPLLGYGLNPQFTGSIAEKILGMESSIMQVTITRGLIGLFSYLFLYITAYNKIKPFVEKKLLFFLLLSFFSIEVVTGQQNLALFLGVLVFLYKYEKINYINKNNKPYL